MKPMSTMIRASSEAGVLVALTYRAFLELADERGGDRQSMEWLVKQATQAQVPICVNVPTTKDPEGPSTTMVIPPKGWTSERVAGWVGARYQEIEDCFGPAERMYTPSEAV